MVVKSCNRRFGHETLHPTKKFTSMNLVQMSCVITQTYLVLTSMEAVRGQTPYSDHTFCHFNLTFGPFHSASSAYQKSPQGMISSIYYCIFIPYKNYSQRCIHGETFSLTSTYLLLQSVNKLNSGKQSLYIFSDDKSLF